MRRKIEVPAMKVDTHRKRLIRSCQLHATILVALCFSELVLCAERDTEPMYAHIEWIASDHDGIAIHYSAADSTWLTPLCDRLSTGKQVVERFFGAAFPRSCIVRVYPRRADLDIALAAEWSIPSLKTECWMVASGIANSLSILSPRVWMEEACEHDPADSAHLGELITHEMVHVYHGQLSPRPDFAGMDDIGWFVEGLATYVSGQLEGSHRYRDRQAIDSGAAPDNLEDAWSGNYRYGVCGSLVKFIDVTYGRDMIKSLLPAVTEEEILTKLKSTESELLGRWREYVVDAEP